jgi:membrane-associated phospholipid phosphatase
MEDASPKSEGEQRASGVMAEAARPWPAVFYRLPQNALRIFSGRNLLWHALAILLTAAIVESGADWRYYLATRGGILQRLAIPAIMIGTFLPVLLPLAFLLAGEAAKNGRLKTAGWALAQAALLGYLLASTYKAFTGRIHPPWHWRGDGLPAAALVDSSHGFQFGFWRGGIFWGWPSSHTTTAFATMVCLAVLFSRNKAVVWCALLWALYVGLSVSVSIHWLSEFVAGAIFGSVVGVVVGRSFKEKQE